MKYIFTSISQILIVSLNTDAGSYKENITCFVNPSVVLENDKITMLDNNEEKFNLSLFNIESINGLVPTDIKDAFVKIKEFISSLKDKSINSLTDAQLRATALPISPRPNTTGANGTTPYKLISLATTNANVVKNTGGNLYSIVAIGLTSTVRFLKFYNKATAPTVGTDVPVMTIPVPANTQGAGISIPFSMGVNFPLGIAIAITAGSADSDVAVIGAGDVLINLTYA